ncbi:MAG: Ldh family oxidoreductase [Dehalococcoidia bacterium]|nr:Ldh family oxidoreductase [Dehalococcoidia bacterium]
MPSIDAKALRDYVQRLFERAGTPPADGAVVAAHLVEANLKGHDSHGVVRAPAYLQSLASGLTTAGAPVRVERESATTALVDGGWNFGQVVARRAMELAIAKARASGVGVAVAYRATHAGRIGAYVEQAVAEGLIGIAMANNHGSGHLVAPFGGREPRLSTNPIAAGFPTGDRSRPWVLDMATAVTAEGKLRVALNQGRRVPPGWLLDAGGHATEDPAVFYGPPRGAILPLGGDAGHKGFGLSMLVEGLAGALSPAGVSRPNAERGGNGLFLLALDPERLGGLAAFVTAFDGLIEWVQRSPFAVGVDEVLVAGEPERRAEAERRTGGIPIDETTWAQLVAAGAGLGVAAPAAAAR